MNDRVKWLTDEARVLTEEERVHLIEALWDTLPDDSGAMLREIAKSRLTSHRASVIA